MRRAAAIASRNAWTAPAATSRWSRGMATMWRSDKTRDSMVNDLQDLNPQSVRDKRMTNDDTRPISNLSMDDAQGAVLLSCST